MGRIRFRTSSKPNRRPLAALSAVFSIALAAVLLTPVAAQARPELPGAGAAPGGFASWADLMKMQNRLNAAAERIVATSATGYAGIVAAPENRELRVYWKGTPPAGAASLIQQLRGSVPVKVLPAAYSQSELLGEAARVIRSPGVSAVSPNADGSGLTVSMRPGLTALALPATSVRVVRQDGFAPGLASRGNDFAPYWGGARWNGCSTGFAIWVGGVTKMLSAGHCADNGNNAFDGGGDFMGTVSGDNNSLDRLYINTSSAGRIYDGGVGTGEFSKPVVGAAHSFVGNWACDSGAYSGARCNIQVKAVNQTVNVGYLIFQLVMAEQVDHTNAIGNGDSGGPAFSLSADPNKVIAMGTNTAIDLSTEVPCTGVPTGGGRHCAWRFWYVDVVNSLSAYGASIVTG
jgi:hypothetical protein